MATVLLVDDDIDFLEQMGYYLNAAGYQTLRAETSKQALELLGQAKPDLAIVDLMLEDVDAGFTLCFRMKKLDAQLPIIMVTAVSSETGMSFDATTDEERSWIKADVILTKPVRFEQVQREIERLLEPKTGAGAPASA